MSEASRLGTRLLLACAVCVVSLTPSRGRAQLVPKPSLEATGPSGCTAYASSRPTTPLPADAAEAQQLIADGQEAALQGEHGAARDAFVKAAARAPGNARVAYYLGREYEVLDSATAAVREYCRYLSLSPEAADADEVRGRIVRLVPASELARVDETRANFRSGVALLQRRQYAAADSVFAAVTRQIPTAAEAYYNRALARAARGERGAAAEDFDKYLELAPTATDRADIRSAMTRLQDRVYNPGPAFLSGVIPGLGQMNTGRPLLGIAVLGAVAGAVAYGLAQQETLEVRHYEDPFGFPYTDTLPKRERPHLAVAAAGAGALWIGAAFEASMYARGTRRRAESIIRFGSVNAAAPALAIAPAKPAAAASGVPERAGMTPFLSVLPRRTLALGISVSIGGR